MVVELEQRAAALNLTLPVSAESLVFLVISELDIDAAARGAY